MFTIRGGFKYTKENQDIVPKNISLLGFLRNGLKKLV